MPEGIGMTRTGNPLPASSCSAIIALETLSKHIIASEQTRIARPQRHEKMAEARENRTHQGRFPPLTDLKSAAATRRHSPPHGKARIPRFSLFGKAPQRQIGFWRGYCAARFLGSGQNFLIAKRRAPLHLCASIPSLFWHGCSNFRPLPDFGRLPSRPVRCGVFCEQKRRQSLRFRAGFARLPRHPLHNPRFLR